MPIRHDVIRGSLLADVLAGITLAARVNGAALIRCSDHPTTRPRPR